MIDWREFCEAHAHGILTLQHVFLLPAFVKALHLGENAFACVVLAIGGLSSFMHLSEIKHKLQPYPVLLPWSNVALNGDRFGAVLGTAFFSVWLWPAVDWWLVLIFVFGVVCSLIGEATDPIRPGHQYVQLIGRWIGARQDILSHPTDIYVPFHTIWHLVVFNLPTYILFCRPHL
jgi:hypothetical protein